MKFEQACEILGVDSRSSPLEIQSAFHEGRKKLEDRLVQAPTDGLKSKYRAAIQQLEQAYEVMSQRESDQDVPAVSPLLSPHGFESSAPHADKTLSQQTSGSTGHRDSPRRTKQNKPDHGALVFGLLMALMVAGASWWYFGNYNPQQKKIELKLTSKISELEVILDSQDKMERVISDELRSIATKISDAQKAGNLKEERFYRTWYEAQEGYLNWLNKISLTHGARVHLKTAQELEDTDRKSALVEAEKGCEGANDLLNQIDDEGFNRIVDPLVSWIKENEKNNSQVWISRIRNSHSEWINAGLNSLLTEMGPVDEAAPVTPKIKNLLVEFEFINGAPHPAWAKKIDRIDYLVASLYESLNQKIVSAERWPGIESNIKSLEGLAGSNMSSQFKKRLDLIKAKVEDLRERLTGLDFSTPRYEDVELLDSYAQWVGDEENEFKDVKDSMIPMGRSFSIESIGAKMLWVKPGQFMMGSPESDVFRQDDEPHHAVEISNWFYLGQCEVTQEQFESLMGYNPSKIKGAQNPVEHLCWLECRDFFVKLNEVETAAGRLPEGLEYGLPTEAQWEYACRAGTTTLTAFGDTLTSSQANFDGEYPLSTVAEKGPHLGKTVTVGQYKPNAWGFYDMHGNVWEWCLDYYSELPPGGANPVGPTSGEKRVVRGGGWQDFGAYCRSAHRGGDLPNTHSVLLGFRIALRNKIASEMNMEDSIHAQEINTQTGN